MNSIDQSTEPQSQLRVDATGVGGCGVRVMYGGGWGYSANKPKAIVQIDILLVITNNFSDWLRLPCKAYTASASC